MATTTIYHNPRCSKSRQACRLLESQGVDARVVRYLDNPPDEATLKKILKLLGVPPIELIRKKEKRYTELGLATKKDDHAALIRAMVENPVLIERPIVIRGDKAVIGRPPETVLEIL